MTQFSKEIALKGVGIAVVSALMLLIASCTEVNDNLGVGIVPSGQHMETTFATFEEGIESYLTYTDSISTGTLDYAYFGSMTDPYYGAKTRASAMVQFAYSLRTDTVVYEERESMPDSMVLLVGMKTLGGDTLKEQTFDVYRMRKLLSRDSLYYNGIDYKEYIDSHPMFTCSFSGKPRGSSSFDTIALKVANKELAEEFMKELWEMDETFYSNDSLFLSKFNGLCITPSGTSPEDAAIYGLNLQWDSSDGPMSYLVLYGHDYPKGEDPSLVEDEIMRAYAISNDLSYTQQRAVTAIENDYSATIFGANINYNVPSTEPLTNPVTEGYVQGVMGVTTTLEFTDEFVENLKALVPEGSSIFINQAMLYLNLAEEDYTYYDYAPTRMGTYVDYARLTAIPDYGYYYEQNYDAELLYGGYLNRTFGRYEINIALYLQQLLQDETEEVSRRITFGMGAYDFMKDAIVKLSTTGSDHPVSIMLTYTVIGK